MKLRISFFILVAVIIVACNKDKFTTIPQVEIKSISPSTVFSGNIIELRGKYTDQEGDLDSVFVVYKWYNGATVVKKDTFRYSYADIGVPAKTKEADIDLDFEYNTNNNPPLVILSGVTRDTTATLGIILKDKENNRSEYKESNQIRLKKP